MDERIQQVTSEMTKVGEEVRASFGELTPEQLNWKPAENSWSVAQCLDHIIRTNHEFDDEAKKFKSGTRKNSFWQNYSPLTGWFGRFLIRTAMEDSKKVKAPSKRIVPPSEIGPDIVERFVSEIAEVNRKLEAFAGVDREKTVLSSPFLRLLTYKLDDALTLLVEHTKRHIRQAKRVTGAEGFPSMRSEPASVAAAVSAK